MFWLNLSDGGWEDSEKGRRLPIGDQSSVFTSPLEDDIQTWPYQEGEAKENKPERKFFYHFGSPDTFTLAWRKVKENNRKIEHHDTRDRKTKLQRNEFHRTEGGEKVTYKFLVN